MRNLLFILVAIAVIEAVAWWWMNPAPAGLGKPVLTYTPAYLDNPTTGTAKFEPHTSSTGSLVTLLPEIVATARPTLRCSTGIAARIERDDGVSIHVAFFEWDHKSTANTLEAFKHLPDECMGSIGHKLIEKAAPRAYKVGDQSLSFDHTIFRDPSGMLIHAFKGTWVSGADTLIGEETRGGVEQWNQLRRKAAFKRFRPAYARVVQGAVRGIANSDQAWEIFRSTILVDLEMK
ncbi:MAG: hypothetical protein ACKO2G_12545 [Verrucomicrobiales bacterium]